MGVITPGGVSPNFWLVGILIFCELGAVQNFRNLQQLLLGEQQRAQRDEERRNNILLWGGRTPTNIFR